ncbi:MAG: DNA-binding response regulator [Stygiobacter sp.]|nr:MAG: DNA-binding response regulator [Stygiobacter sp.]KAF0210819.1 MAG: DNA-binding response [Ignavibacteria bacterium]
MSAKILIVDDERDILELLKYNLTRNGYSVFTAENGKVALEKLSLNPDLIILDVMMPIMDGFEVCSKIKSFEKYKNTPIIFLTAKTSEADEIKGLSLGANDFIQKPIAINKIIARVKANLRTYHERNESLLRSGELSVGPIEISREKYSVLVDKKPIELARKEFEILFLLASNPGKVFNREKILNEVWGNEVFVVERTVDVHLLNIRKKLEKYAYLIETIKGVGYRFKST